MAFDISDSQMYDEVMEVSDRLRLSDRSMEFLEDIEDRARDDDLSPAQREWLEAIYEQACDLDEGHHV